MLASSILFLQGHEIKDVSDGLKWLSVNDCILYHSTILFHHADAQYLLVVTTVVHPKLYCFPSLTNTLDRFSE